jgi:hypothetical protein
VSCGRWRAADTPSRRRRNDGCNSASIPRLSSPPSRLARRTASSPRTPLSSLADVCRSSSPAVHGLRFVLSGMSRLRDQASAAVKARFGLLRSFFSLSHRVLPSQSNVLPLTTPSTTEPGRRALPICTSCEYGSILSTLSRLREARAPAQSTSVRPAASTRAALCSRAVARSLGPVCSQAMRR